MAAGSAVASGNAARGATVVREGEVVGEGEAVASAGAVVRCEGFGKDWLSALLPRWAWEEIVQEMMRNEPQGEGGVDGGGGGGGGGNGVWGQG